MRPVILLKLPNQPCFLGTFDTEKLRDWWKSEPMPDGVLDIIDNEWAYGQYHAAIALKVDGTYSILQSPDYGKTWKEVFNTTSKLLTLTRIDYGWLLASAEDGWYASYNSAKDWSKISSQAPNCLTVVTVGDDILFAHDGNNVWKSINRGINWTNILNCHDFICYHTHGSNKHLTWGSQTFPALAAANGLVLAGAGPYFLASSDFGLTWNEPWCWGGGRTALCPWLGEPAERRVIQIVHTDTRGTGATDTSFIIRVWFPNKGTVMHLLTINPWNWIEPRFDRPFLGIDVGNLTAYDVLRPGETFHDKIVVSAQSVFNTQRGCFEPAISYSFDGGREWIDVDISQAKVFEGDPAQGSYTLGGPFLEDDCTLWTWHGCPCHNYGNWVVTKGVMERGISWEMDFKTQGYRDREYLSSFRLARVTDVTSAHDALLRKAVNLGKSFDSIVKADVPKPLRANSLIKKAFDNALNHDMILVQRMTTQLLNDGFFRKALDSRFNSQAYVRGEVDGGYGMGVILTRSRFNEMLIKVERLFPQIYDIRAPMIQYPVYDSRRDGMPSGD
jgi:hypothetical protein